MKSLNWVRTKSVDAASQQAPKGPGVYAIGQVQREAGLIVSVAWQYVGCAKTQLGRRIGQHRMTDERNMDLRRWLTGHPAGLEVWFASTSSVKEATNVERQLIQRLDPPFNILLRPPSDKKAA